MQITTQGPISDDKKNHLDKDGFVDIEISTNLSPKDLSIIIEKHEKEPYFNALLELIIEHPNSTPELINEIYENYHVDIGVNNAIATSLKTPKSILKKLKNCQFKSVREHAKANLSVKKSRPPAKG